MSVYGDILDEILSVAVPAYTTSRDPKPFSAVHTYPYAYAFMQSHAADRLEWTQEAREYTAVLVIATRGETQEEIYTRIDAVVTNLYGEANRSLSSSVDWFHVAGVVPFELQNPADGKGATFTIVCRVDQ